MAIEIDTREYQFSHGKQPRGYGYWAFFFDKETEPFWHTGTYTDAKRSAIAWAVTKGYQTVKVGS